MDNGGIIYSLLVQTAKNPCFDHVLVEQQLYNLRALSKGLSQWHFMGCHNGALGVVSMVQSVKGCPFSNRGSLHSLSSAQRHILFVFPLKF